ncbi:hypothetical protein HRG84_12050 [Flavisolibacter sp. BT320]|nr:hypothetical protein [Flavisolibacter longurius]
MQIDLLGKIKEKRLSYNNTLLPLFEAVVNSIQAIEDGSASRPGLISIEIIRVPQTNLEFNEVTLISRPPVLDFIIRDNGIGFTDENYESFYFAHSTYKQNRGGKGIGRIIWLRAFNVVEIESVYPVNGTYQHRRFQFLPTRDGVEKHELIKDLAKQKRFTEVRLKGLKSDFQKWCNTDAEDIAFKIIEHCFIYFIQKDCPRISIIDGENELVVNDLFHLYTKDKVNSKKIKVKKLKFDVKLVKLYGRKADNKIHYCAHTREVQNDKISLEIPELDTFYTDENGEKYSLAAYVTGDYLNTNVNEERTEINFIKTNDMYPDEITISELREAVCEVIRKEFSKLIESLSENRQSKIKRFISEHPRYRQLLKYKPNEVNKIPSSFDGEKLELELFKILQKLELEVKSEADDLLKGLDKFDNQADFKKRYSDYYKKIIDVGNAKLSEYIVYRKVVLDILEKQLQKTDNGKFVPEASIHKLVFPLKKESDDIGYDEHNLWIIDERLAFHKYLASDKTFKQLDELESISDDRADLIVFNKPFAFSDNEKPYSSIVLVEFKRPMRDDYDDEENPITQVNRYARHIIEGKITDKNGRQFDIREKTPIYAYIICDLTPKLRLFAKDAAYKELPDNDGFFNYNDNYSMYVEIISFDKLVRDSKHRNKVLFEKLNLSSL